MRQRRITARFILSMIGHFSTICASSQTGRMLHKYSAAGSGEKSIHCQISTLHRRLYETSGIHGLNPWFPTILSTAFAWIQLRISKNPSFPRSESCRGICTRRGRQLLHQVRLQLPKLHGWHFGISSLLYFRLVLQRYPGDINEHAVRFLQHFRAMQGHVSRGRIHGKPR